MNVVQNDFKLADLVWLFNETKQVGLSPKLQPTFVGPYVIIDKYGEVNYKIQLDNKGKSRVIHHDKLKKYTGVDPPRWTKKVIEKLKSSLKSKCHKEVQTIEHACN